ncbi:hypothetical protein GCM10010177_82890 [Actinomadura citrea]|nr:hypothetical protein GCM10010177_82890 [Actinomadura citrea]
MIAAWRRVNPRLPRAGEKTQPDMSEIPLDHSGNFGAAHTRVLKLPARTRVAPSSPAPVIGGHGPCRRGPPGRAAVRTAGEKAYESSMWQPSRLLDHSTIRGGITALKESA